MVDKRILPDLRWIAQRYPIYVTDGYSGPLPNGEHVGCDECHASGSDHYNGLAVDIVPLGAGTKCDATWAPITRLALWAEPVQNAAGAALPLGRLRRRRRPRLRQPPPPLLEPRRRPPVPARRMGRSLPGRPARPWQRTAARQTAATGRAEGAARPFRRHLHRPHRRRRRRASSTELRREPAGSCRLDPTLLWSSRQEAARHFIGCPDDRPRRSRSPPRPGGSCRRRLRQARRLDPGRLPARERGLPGGSRRRPGRGEAGRRHRDQRMPCREPAGRGPGDRGRSSGRDRDRAQRRSPGPSPRPRRRSSSAT